MSKYTRRKGKRDTIEPEIIQLCKDLGFFVIQTDIVDLIVQKDGRTELLEVKTGNAPLTADQAKLLAQGWVIHVIRSVEDARKLLS